jgi:hypothetical protein
MNRRILVALLGAILTVALPMTSSAFPACDSYGQDWNINLGPFGGTFPYTMLATGCRDCNKSLGCGAALALDGTVTFSGNANGIVTVWSMAAFDPSTSACVTTNWNGAATFGSLNVVGQVSNELGPFGNFTLKLNTACAASPSSDGDPSRGN